MIPNENRKFKNAPKNPIIIFHKSQGKKSFQYTETKLDLIIFFLWQTVGSKTIVHSVRW